MMMKVLAVLVFLFGCAHALPKYRDAMPNPQATKTDGLVCRELGHTGCVVGKATVNQFAQDFKANGYKYDEKFCKMDSDGDGVSNGAELGDPCCVFTVGATPTRTNDLSHPGLKDSVPKNESNRNCSDPAAAKAAPTNTSDVCFPGMSTVQLESGDYIQMSQVKIGDKVLVDSKNNLYSSVFMFTHAVSNVKYPFLQLFVSERQTPITLTKGHFIYANGILVESQHVKVGDVLESNGQDKRVIRIEEIVANGLYNPQTNHGDIVVDGIRASTYTQSVPVTAAHALLAPFRSLYSATKRYCTAFESSFW